MIGPTEHYYELGIHEYRGLANPSTLTDRGMPPRATIEREVTEALKQHGLVHMPDELAGQYLVIPYRENGVDKLKRLERSRLYSAAEPDELLAAVRAHVGKIAERHGPGCVWFLSAPVGVVQDDGRIAIAEKDGRTLVLLRTYYGHEKQARPL